MKFNVNLYHCNECKKILPTLDKLLFIEEKSNKGFCSEECIEDFYLPISHYLEKMELDMRMRLGIQNEIIETKFSDQQLVDEILASPDEVWKSTNELEEDIFTYMKHFSDFSGAIICKVYNGDISYIFLSSCTRSTPFLAGLRVGEKIDKPKETVSREEEIPENLSEDDFIFMQLLENKKSKLLADLLTKRKENDIPFEDFTLYDSYFSESLETPDEVFETKDNEGDTFFVYIKSFISETTNFFYIISCLKRKDGNGESPTINAFPVLAFPTNDLDLYSEFREGKKISGHLKS